MKKPIGILIPLLAIGVVFAIGHKNLGWENNFTQSNTASSTNPFIEADPVKLEAWTTFEKYLEFVHMHDLAGARNLSYQTSAACNDPLKEEECFALMDNLYNIASFLELNAFTGILSDEKQIVMYTEGPTVAMLYFVVDENGAPKVLGLRFCFEDETNKGSCADASKIKLDKDSNGWWDSVESIFYK